MLGIRDVRFLFGAVLLYGKYVFAVMPMMGMGGFGGKYMGGGMGIGGKYKICIFLNIVSSPTCKLKLVISLSLSSDKSRIIDSREEMNIFNPILATKYLNIISNIRIYQDT